MKLVKAENQQVILNHVRIANNPLSRVIGLLFTKDIAKGEGLCLKPCNGVHSIGMRYALDILYLNKSGGVEKIIENFSPGKFGPVSFKTRSIIEMRAGTLKSAGVLPGEKLQLVP